MLSSDAILPLLRALSHRHLDHGHPGAPGDGQEADGVGLATLGVTVENGDIGEAIREETHVECAQIHAGENTVRGIRKIE